MVPSFLLNPIRTLHARHLSPPLERYIVSYLSELTKRDVSYKRKVGEKERKQTSERHYSFAGKSTPLSKKVSSFARFSLLYEQYDNEDVKMARSNDWGNGGMNLIYCLKVKGKRMGKFYQLQWIRTSTGEWEAGRMCLECWKPSQHVREGRGKPRNLVAGYSWQPTFRQRVKGNPRHVCCWGLLRATSGVAPFGERFMMNWRVVIASNSQIVDMEAAIYIYMYIYLHNIVQCDGNLLCGYR